MTRAKLFEVTKYTPAWMDTWPLQYDAIIQRIGSGSWRKVADYKDYKYDIWHPLVMEFPIRLGYHYLRSTSPWKDQADQMIEVANGDFHAYICDFEKIGNVINRAFVAMAMEFNNYVQAQTKRRVLTYTNRSIYQDFIVPFDGARAANFGFHYAYPTDSFFLKPNIETLQPPLPRGRLGWDILQYSFGEHNTDHIEKDVFNGTVADLRAWLGIDVAPPPTPDPAIFAKYEVTVFDDKSAKIKLL